MSLPNRFLQLEMENEVRRQMSRGASFTAYDISRAVQASGVRERHLHLKAAVHAMYDRGEMVGYRRRQVRVPGGGTPFLYEPDRAPVNRFATARNAAPTRRQTQTNQRVLDAWGRLRVPARALRAVGALPGTIVWATIDAAQRTITLSLVPKSGERPYHVDRYGNVRLSVGRGLAASVQAFLIASNGGLLTAQG